MIWHCVLVASQAAAPVCTQVDWAWAALQAFPHLPQLVALAQRSKPSSTTPSQLLSRPSQISMPALVIMHAPVPVVQLARHSPPAPVLPELEVLLPPPQSVKQ